MKKWRCTVCGQVFEGDAPPVPCPVCGAGEAAFEAVEEIAPARWRCTVCGQVFDGSAPPVPCPVCGAGEAAFERLEVAAGAFEKDTNDKYVLVGGGVAALEAARALRKRNKTARIVMVAGEAHPPYNRPSLSDVLADGLSFSNILLEEAAFYTENRIELRTGAMAVSVDPGARQVKLSTGDAVPYTKLLLATGANPFNPIESGYGAIPVLSLRCYDDALALLKQAPGKRVVLVGGGILGLEAALALRERGCTITVVEFAPRILPLQADEEVSRRLAERLEALGIAVLVGASVQRAGPHGVVLSDGSEMAADLVLASMGVRSEVSLALALGLELSRGIVVDEYMHTSHKDIWAAGDCAEFGGRVQAVVGAAAGMGAVAGASMAGDESAPYVPFTPATMLEAPGFSLFSVGAAGAATPETAVYQNEQTGAYRKLLFKAGRLAGALFLGGSPGARAVAAVATGQRLPQALSLLEG